MLRVMREGQIMGIRKWGEGSQRKEVKPSGLFRSPWGPVLLVRAQQNLRLGKQAGD